jgi:hypothetical protein
LRACAWVIEGVVGEDEDTHVDESRLSQKPSKGK